MPRIEHEAIVILRCLEQGLRLVGRVAGVAVLDPDLGAGRRLLLAERHAGVVEGRADRRVQLPLAGVRDVRTRWPGRPAFSRCAGHTRRAGRCAGRRRPSGRDRPGRPAGGRDAVVAPHQQVLPAERVRAACDARNRSRSGTRTARSAHPARCPRRRCRSRALVIADRQFRFGGETVRELPAGPLGCHVLAAAADRRLGRLGGARRERAGWRCPSGRSSSAAACSRAAT